MKLRIFASLLLCLCLHAFADDKLVFGINPYKNFQELQETNADFIAYLEKALGKRIVMVVSNDYDHLLTLIEQGNVDFASISPKLFAKLRRLSPDARYLATFQFAINGKNRSTYHSLIITRANSSIQTIQDLKGKNFGFTDQSSTSGYFYPRLLMRQNGIDPDANLGKIFLLKKHSKIIQALLEGSIDAGAIYDGVYLSLTQKEKAKLRILGTSEEIPYDAVVASKSLDENIARKIHDLLLTYRADTALSNGVTGFEEKPVSLYDRLND